MGQFMNQSVLIATTIVPHCGPFYTYQIGTGYYVTHIRQGVEHILLHSGLVFVGDSDHGPTANFDTLREACQAIDREIARG